MFSKAVDDICLKTFIKDIAQKIIVDKRISSTDMKNINRLCKKVDVAPRIRAVYSNDLNRALSDKSLDEQSTEGLMVILFCLSKKTCNLKFYNSALKLRDRLISSNTNELYSLYREFSEEVWNDLAPRIK